MQWLEQQIHELEQFCPPLTRQPDFDDFWRKTLEHTHRVPLRPLRQLVDYPNRNITVYDIDYCGFDDTPIHGWLILPMPAASAVQDLAEPAGPSRTPVPCLIHYHGFGGSRGYPADFMAWVALGVAVLSIDCRDQSGMTGNHQATNSGASQSVVCRGILDPQSYYFRSVYMDCVKAIDFACAQTEINPQRIIIEGGSQGGALGMAVCSLDTRPWLAMVDVPSNSLLEERVIRAHGSFAAVTDYLKDHPGHTEQALVTLSYFDTMNMAEHIKCPLLASVGLNDQTCPARCYYASYNRITSTKQIRIYPFNGHEGGHGIQHEEKIRFLAEALQRVDKTCGCGIY